MAQNYTRQSAFSDGDTITATLFNDEYNQLVNTFSYSSSDAGATGHRHDGSTGEGGNIYRIGDLDFLNKIEADSVNNRWGFWVEVSSIAVEQLRIQDGAIVPVTTNDIDLGTSSLEFKNLYLDGTANIDSLVADTVDINGGTIDGATIGGASAGAGTFTNLTATGTTTLAGASTTADITFGDNDKAIFGAGSDLQIYSDGTQSIIQENGPGALYIQGTHLNLNNAAGTSSYITAIDGGAVTLFSGGSAKLATTSTGIDVTGSVTADGLTVSGNILLSNEGDELQFNTSSTPVNKIYSDDTYTTNGLTVFAENGVTLLSTNNYLLLDDTGTNEMVLNVDGGERMRVTSTGIDVTGAVTADGLTVDTDIATSTASFRATSNSTTIGQKIGSLDFYNGTTNDAGTIEVRRASGGNAYSDMSLVASANGNRSNQLLLSTNGDISFYEDTGTTAKFFWDASAESLGIGTTSPGQNLEIASTFPAIRLTDTNASNAISEITGGDGILALSADGTGAIANSRIVMNVDSSERMRIDSSGNVGIGTTSASSYNSNWNNLVIDGGTSSGVTIVSGTTGDGTIGFADGTTGDEQYRGYIQYRHSTDLLKFGTAGTERMVIDSSGNLLVGKTSSDLGATAGIELNGQYDVGYFTRSAEKALVVNRLSTDGTIAEFRKDGTAVGSIGTESGSLDVYSSGASRVGLRLAQAVIPMLNGSPSPSTVDLGLSTRQFKNLYLSGGVYLGGTGAANLLDDYEEGSWTPTTSSDATGAFTTVEGFYRKVGSVVHVFGQLEVSTGFTGNFIGGLPFIVANVFSISLYSSVGAVLCPTGNVGIVPREGSTTCQLFDNFDSDTGHNPAVGTYRFALTYMAT